MQSPAFENFADTPRKKLFWAVLAVVVVFQLVALYMVCAQQMQKAQVREAMWSAQSGALVDCLDYMPKSTVRGCRSHVAGRDSNISAAVPANFSYR